MFSPGKWWNQGTARLWVTEGTRPDIGDPALFIIEHAPADIGGVRYRVFEAPNVPRPMAEGGNWGGGFLVQHPSGDTFGCVARDRIHEAATILGTLRREYGTR